MQMHISQLYSSGFAMPVHNVICQKCHHNPKLQQNNSWFLTNLLPAIRWPDLSYSQAFSENVSIWAVAPRHSVNNILQCCQEIHLVILLEILKEKQVLSTNIAFFPKHQHSFFPRCHILIFRHCFTSSYFPLLLFFLKILFSIPFTDGETRNDNARNQVKQIDSSWSFTDAISCKWHQYFHIINQSTSLVDMSVKTEFKINEFTFSVPAHLFLLLQVLNCLFNLTTAV